MDWFGWLGSIIKIRKKLGQVRNGAAVWVIDHFSSLVRTLISRWLHIKTITLTHQWLLNNRSRQHIKSTRICIMTISESHKFIKPGFFANALCINSLALLYYSLPVTLEVFIAIAAVLMLMVRAVRPSQFASSFIDVHDCSKRMMGRLNIQLVRFNWLINKFTKQCLNYTLLLLLLILLIDHLIHPSLSFWITFNLINFYLYQTKHCRNLLKYRLGMFKEYNKYVIHIIEPPSPERAQSTLTIFQEELKEI